MVYAEKDYLERGLEGEKLVQKTVSKSSPYYLFPKVASL